MKAAHLYKVGQFLSLAALLCVPMKTIAGEFDASRAQNWKEFDEAMDGKPAQAVEAKPVVEDKPVAKARPAVEAKPVVEAQPKPVVEAPPAAAPVAAPAAAKSKDGIFRDCPECPEMVAIPAGRFEMGEPGKSHEVPVAAFAMGKTEVTQGQWKALMNRNPSKNAKCGDDCPVESVSWEDVQSFIEILNEKTGKKYRLASGAEWEYACRAGGKHRYCGTADAYTSAWHHGNSGNETHIVATQKPNAFGLYDMNGNVHEWTNDGSGSYYMVRGGAYDDDLDKLYPHLRDSEHINGRYPSMGFRLVRTLP